MGFQGQRFPFHARLFRIAIAPDEANGLDQASEIMIDKISSLRRERIGRRVGALSRFDLEAVDAALAAWLGL